MQLLTACAGEKKKIYPLQKVTCGFFFLPGNLLIESIFTKTKMLKLMTANHAGSMLLARDFAAMNGLK